MTTLLPKAAPHARPRPPGAASPDSVYDGLCAMFCRVCVCPIAGEYGSLAWRIMPRLCRDMRKTLPRTPQATTAHGPDKYAGDIESDCHGKGTGRRSRACGAGVLRTLECDSTTVEENAALRAGASATGEAFRSAWRCRAVCRDERRDLARKELQVNPGQPQRLGRTACTRLPSFPGWGHSCFTRRLSLARYHAHRSPTRPASNLVVRSETAEWSPFSNA